jgi:Ca2+-binding EF-hand superfamily protein
MIRITLIAALALAASVALCAVAAEGHGPRGNIAERLKQADTNGDGMISRDEAKALPMISKHFDEIDANRDGQITAEELRAFHEKRRSDHWKKLDTDGDGRVSRAEAQANSPRLFQHFDEIDADHDGFITPEELRAAMQRHHHER